MTASGGPLEGRVAFITGAARGQGRAHAVRLANEGADIIAIDICGPISDTITYPLATSEDLAETVQAVEATGRKVLAREVDIRDLAALAAGGRRRCRAVRPAGHRGGQRRRAELGPDVRDVRGAVGHRHRRQPERHLADDPRRRARDDRGRQRRLDHHRQLIGRTEGHARATGTTRRPSTAWSRITNALAIEVGEFGIRVNSIHPYSIDTPMVEKEAMMEIFAKYPQYLHSFSPMPYHPVNHEGKKGLQEFMTPEEVSDVVAWLAGDGSATISGQPDRRRPRHREVLARAAPAPAPGCAG